MTIHETYIATKANQQIEYGFAFKEDIGCEDSLFELVLGEVAPAESHLIPNRHKEHEWVADAFLQAYGKGGHIIGYQVVSADGTYWGERESFEVLCEQVAMSDLKEARAAGGGWSLMAVRDGDIQEPSFVGFQDCDEDLDVGLCAAMISALACGDKGFSRAGISFVQDGGVTLVKHQGYTVAMVVGRFDVASVVSQIRTNIGKHARDLMLQIDHSLASINWPVNHFLSLDMAQNLGSIVNRGSCQITAFAGGRHGATEQVHADIFIHLGECRARIQLNAGQRFGEGQELLFGSAGDVRAPSYTALFSTIASRINQVLAVPFNQ